MIWDWLIANKEVMKALGPFAVASTALIVGIWTILINRHFNRANHQIMESSERTNRTRLRLDLFEKRFAVYLNASELAIRGANAQITDLELAELDDKLIQTWQEAMFLFPDEGIAKKLQGIRKSAFELRALRSELDNMDVLSRRDLSMEDRQRSAEIWKRQREIIASLYKELETLTDLFKPHLIIDDRY